jgi:hypothetical protein
MAAETSEASPSEIASASAAEEEGEEDEAAAGTAGNDELTSGAPCGPAATSERAPNGADTGLSSNEGLGEGAAFAFIRRRVEAETETRDTTSALPAATPSLEAAAFE